MFADDLKIYRTITSTDDNCLLQNDLNNILKWCDINCMLINAQKCFHIKFTRKKVPHSFDYLLDSNAVTEVNEIRDLGIIIDSKLQFSSHIDSIIKKAAQMLGFIKRQSKGFRADTKIILYNSLVRSHLEFASSAWSPSYAANSHRIESIQRAFTRHLAFISSNVSHKSPYDHRLTFFNMKSLRNRREIHDLLFLYKIINNLIDCPDLLESISFPIPFKYPRYPIKKLMCGPKPRTNLGSHSPVNRLCDLHNIYSNKLDNVNINSHK